MKLFTPLYNKTLEWAGHRHAPRYLGAMSFAESSFFPIPPDIMLIPMTVAKPEKWQWFAFLTTLTSVLGGIAGYLIGLLAFDVLQPWIVEWGYGHKLELAQAWFEKWGIWVVLAAGFSPIPYKLFTITAGALSMGLIPFIIASIIGRGARFYLVSGLVAWLGPKMEPLIMRYIEWLGWFVVAALGIGILITQIQV